MMTTLKELWKIAKTNNVPLLGKTTDLQTLSFMSEYLTNRTHIDRNIAVNKGVFEPIWNRNEEDTDADVLDVFQDDVFGVLLKNKENYLRLYSLMNTDYDPLTNYDKTSTIRDAESGEDVDTNQIGARRKEDTIGQKSLTDVYGATQQTSQYGAVSETDTNGARSDSTTHGQQLRTEVNGAKTTTTENEFAGFNSNSYNDANKATESEGAVTNTTTDTAYTDTNSIGTQTNTHSETAKTDTVSEASKTDTHTEGQQQNIYAEDTATDVLTKEYGHVTSHTEHTTGNIGVTTSQQMAQSEIDLWSTFKFYDIIIDDIIKELCTLRIDGYECF